MIYSRLTNKVFSYLLVFKCFKTDIWEVLETNERF